LHPFQPDHLDENGGVRTHEPLRKFKKQTLHVFFLKITAVSRSVPSHIYGMDIRSFFTISELIIMRKLIWGLYNIIMNDLFYLISIFFYSKVFFMSIRFILF